MTDADNVGLVEDVLGIWGEDAARELAEQCGVDLEALGKWRPPKANLQPSTSKVHALSLERHSCPQEV
jgi:hypothetical protein